MSSPVEEPMDAGIEAAATLAVSIGANSAVFSVVSAILLRPLPFTDPDRLVLLYQSNAARGWDHAPVSFPAFTLLKQKNAYSPGARYLGVIARRSHGGAQA